MLPYLITIEEFFSGFPVSTTNKTDRHDIAVILLKVALNTTNPTQILILLKVVLNTITLALIKSVLSLEK
jgi:hypothetical protein